MNEKASATRGLNLDPKTYNLTDGSTQTPHHVTHKKKWVEYLLEFFMLFLAVFLGFVAENIREHTVENDPGKPIRIILSTGFAK